MVPVLLQKHSGIEAEERLFFLSSIFFTACAYSALAIRLQIALTLSLHRSNLYARPFFFEDINQAPFPVHDTV